MRFFISEGGWFGEGSDHGHEIALRANFAECQPTPVRQMVVRLGELAALEFLDGQGIAVVH